MFYISGHGFGHASRTIEVINAWLARQPDLRVIVRTSAVRWLFERTVRDGLKIGPPRADPGVFFETVDVDPGMVQVDSLRLDVDKSVQRARAFMTNFARYVAAEAAWLQSVGARLVVADVPPLGVAAAHRAGVPAVVLSNFTWDWIYSAYPGTGDIAAAMGEAYAGATLALRLPMHGGFDTFRSIVDVPFIARRSARAPEETRRRLGLPLDQQLVLVSFGGYGLGELNLEALGALDGFVVIVSGHAQHSSGLPRLPLGRRGSVLPFDEVGMYAAGFRYEDLVRAVDIVVSKPGYGIIAECLANDTALLYTPRGHFIEYDVLVAAMPRFLRVARIDHADLFAGRWGGPLAALVAEPDPPERPAVNGAEVAVDLLSTMGPGGADRP